MAPSILAAIFISDSRGLLPALPSTATTLLQSLLHLCFLFIISSVSQLGCFALCKHIIFLIFIIINSLKVHSKVILEDSFIWSKIWREQLSMEVDIGFVSLLINAAQLLSL